MKLFNTKTAVLLWLCLSLQTSYAFTLPAGVSPADVGQALQSVTNAVDTGRVAKQIQQSLPKPANAVLKPQPKPVEAPSNVPKIHFRLTAVIITGNTVFSDKELQEVFKPYIGKDIPVSTLEKMVHDVTTKYRDAGYILSRAILPPQTVRQGVVRIQVVEGFVSSVSVKGGPPDMQAFLLKYGTHIKESKPLKVQKLERYALLMNDLPGVSVQSVLTPSPTVPAAADLTLVTSQKRGTAFISIDNFGTRYIGPNETSFGGSLFSLFSPGDNNSLRFSYTSNPHELHYMEFNRTQPLGSEGLRWLFDTNFAETRPDFVLEPVNVIGRNLGINTDFSYPIIRDRSKNLLVHAGANYQNVTSTILGTPFYEDRIRTLIVGSSFNIIDEWRGINDMGLDITHGFDILGAHDHANQSRPQGHSIYTRFNATLSRLQSLTSRLTLYVVLHGQYTKTPLLATEQYGVGGPDIGRGYDPSEIVGDSGASGKVELRIDTSPGWKFLSAIQFYGFYDSGKIWNIDNVDLPGSQSLTSVGGGARFTFTSHLSGNFYYGKPLTQKVAVLSIMNQNAYYARSFFQIVATG